MIYDKDREVYQNSKDQGRIRININNIYPCTLMEGILHFFKNSLPVLMHKVIHGSRKDNQISYINGIKRLVVKIAVGFSVKHLSYEPIHCLDTDLN